MNYFRTVDLYQRIVTKIAGRSPITLWKKLKRQIVKQYKHWFDPMYVFMITGILKKGNVPETIYVKAKTSEQAIQECESFATNLEYTGKKWKMSMDNHA